MKRQLTLFVLALLPLFLPATPKVPVQEGGVVNTDGNIKNPTNLNIANGKIENAREPVFNVKTDFRAYGDGAHDDTTAIRNALSAAATAGGGRVVLPFGTYSTTGTLTLSAGVALQGSTYGYATNAGSEISYTGTGTALVTDTECTVSDLNITGPDHYPTTKESIGIKPAAKSAKWNFRNVKVNDFTSGLVLDTTWIGMLDNFVATYCTNGVLIQNSQVNSVNFHGGAIESCGKAVYVTGGPHDGIHFDGVTIEGNDGYGIDVSLANNPVNLLGNFTVDHCYFEQNGSAGYDIYFDSAYARAPNVTASFFVKTHICLAVNAATRMIISNNTFRPGNGIAGTRKSIAILGSSAVETYIGPNQYETSAFTPSTDDNGSNTAICAADLFAPPALSNGVSLMARDSAGTRTGVIGVATGGKYVVSSSSETVTGNEAFRWQDGNGATLSQLLAGGTWVVGGKSRIISSSGTPLDKVRAPIGSIFLRTDGGAGTSFYVKESGGSGSSGWVPGLTSNQRITLSNDVTGSGNGSTTTTVSSGTVPSAKAAISSHEVALVVAVWVAAFGAIAAAFIAIWQARFTVRVQTILQLDKSWASDSMRAARRKAAGSLLFGKPDANVDRVLDYFETIAGIYAKPHRLFRPSVPPDNWARHKFYWYAVCYWSKSREYIDAVRQRPTEGAAWENLCDLMPRWISAEGGPPTQKDIDDFIANERSA